MATRCADLTCVVLPAATFPKQHQARVFGAFRVRSIDSMPPLAVRAVQLIARAERRILGGEIVRSHSAIVAPARDRAGPATSALYRAEVLIDS
jgi:hypothetical protein